MLERRIAAPVVANPVLAANTYDQAVAGYYNVGRLTTASNASATQKFYHNGGGAVQRLDTVDSAGTHTAANGFHAGRTLLYKTYSPGALTVGTSAARWTYDGAGRLKTIPGMITDQAYELDGQTASITYANGVTTAFTYSPTRRWLTRIVTKDAGGANPIENATAPQFPCEYPNVHAQSGCNRFSVFPKQRGGPATGRHGVWSAP